MMRAAMLATLAVTSYGQIAAPQLGFIPDGATLRPVAGIPAAAAVGSPVTFNRNLSQTVIAPSGAFGLAVDADSGEVLLVTADGTATPIPNLAPTPSLIQFSPQGSAAVLLYSGINQAQIVTGLSGNPAIRGVDLSFLAKAPGTLAVSDDGLFLAGGWPGIVYLFSPAGNAGLPVDSQAAALAFAPGSSDLALVSADGATLWNAAGQSTLASFANPVNPVAAALDSKRLVIAEASGAILTLDRSSGLLSSLDCQCAPLGLFRMSRSVYRLTALDGGAFKLLDADQNAIWFAPLALPPPPATATSGDQQ